METITMSSIGQYGTRVRRKIKRDGLYNTLAQMCLGVESVVFDKKYGVDTHRNIPLADLNIPHDTVEQSRGYQPILVNHLRRVLQTIGPKEGEVLVDFGSGKGRVLLISSMYPFAKVVGVEFSDELCSIARTNAEKFRSRSLCPIEIHCIDAGEYKVMKEETIFFFFNPFEEPIRQRVIKNIETSLAGNPRKIKIVYINFKPQELTADSSPFELVTDSTLHGRSFQVYEAG